MLIDEMLKEEGVLTEMCYKYHISYTSAGYWKRHKYIPMKKQIEIEKRSKGKYKADLMHAEKWLRNWYKKQ